MEDTMSVIDRILAPFTNRREKQIEKDIRETARMQAEIKSRLDALERVIKKADMNGEERWFLCSQHRGNTNGKSD